MKLQKSTGRNLLYLVISTISLSIHSQPYLDLTQKDVFNLGYPAYFMFRGEMSNADHADYNAWVKSVIPATGAIQKYLDEELMMKPSATIIQNWVNRYATEQPQKLLLLHLNGQARQVENRESVNNLYFPGHWVYEVGSIVTNNCLSTDSIIKVASTAPYSLQAYIDNNVTPFKYYPSYILLVKLDDFGNRLWNESEVVQVKNIDKTNNTLTIKRGLIYTSPLNFDANKTYAAPFDCCVFSSQCMRYYNLSSNCPKNSNGKTAADVFTDELAGYFAPTGILRNMNGIAFDVNYFDASKYTKWDTNNDGKADGGWIDNVNCWQKGDYAFLKQLRTRLGINCIITADGQHDGNQQAVGILNGIESEGLVQHNDGWRGISRTINTHLYWQTNNTMNNQFRYIVLKFMDDYDALNVPRLQRFAIATASCLGVFLANIPNMNIFPTWMRQSNALGTPKGELVRYAKLSTNLQTLSNTSLVSKMTSDNTNIALVNEGIQVSTKNGFSARDNMSVTLSDVNLPSGDITVFIDAQAIDPLEGMTLTDKVPRSFYCTLSNLPNYGEGNTVNSYYSDIYGFIGTSKVEELSFYYRRPGVVAGKQTLTFTVQGRGKFIIKSIKIYNQADILIRQFDNGIAIMNPSFDAKLVNLASVFPTLGLNQVTVPAVDAYFLQTNLTGVETPIKKNNFVSRLSENSYKINNSENKKYEVNLYNLCGQNVQKIHTNQFSLPNKGIFLLQIMDNGKIIGTEKMIY